MRPDPREAVRNRVRWTCRCSRRARYLGDATTPPTCTVVSIRSQRHSRSFCLTSQMWSRYPFPVWELWLSRVARGDSPGVSEANEGGA